MKMKYPMKSNWISYKKDYKTEEYVVKNHFWDEEYRMTRKEIKFLNTLNGKRNPKDMLIEKFGMTKSEADNYMDSLEKAGIVRTGNRVTIDTMSRMITLIRIQDSKKYKGVATVLLAILLLALVPVSYIGILAAEHLFKYAWLFDLWDSTTNILLGSILGILIGVILHELAHAVSAAAFGGKVMEFGITFCGMPAVYTLVDDTMIESRMGRIITGLAGVLTNFMITALCLVACVKFDYFITVFFMIAMVNLEMGLTNLLWLEESDGKRTMAEILGTNDVLDKGLIKKYRKNRNAGNSEAKVKLGVAYVFEFNRMAYPLLILLNICILMGW